MTKKYVIHSGKRAVSIQYSVSPLQAAVDYAKAFGSTDAEIMRVGVDCVSWRGARFTAVLVPAGGLARAPQDYRDIPQTRRALSAVAHEPPPCRRLSLR